MRITIAYNGKADKSESQAELLEQSYIDRVREWTEKLNHTVTPVDMTCSNSEAVDRLLNSCPEMILNIAEGTEGTAREAKYPAIYEQLGIPYTGANSAMLLVSQDKRLCEKIFEVWGVRVPRGIIATPQNPEIPDSLHYPLMIKPNYEGSSKGIYEDSIVRSEQEAQKVITDRLEKYPAGVIIEEYIEGREFTLGRLETWPRKYLEIVEYTFGDKENIHDFETKEKEEESIICPPDITREQRHAIVSIADHVFRIMPCPDFGRVDLRMKETGEVFLIEVNPLTSLRWNSAMILGGKAIGLEAHEIINYIIQSALSRYHIPLH
ncbi:MAG: ATP-grasp domain-containing protein [Chitinivibrionales bacterium]|nr:ATP-grasp domain-containing protein [Chitinivibrionales bacterium]